MIDSEKWTIWQYRASVAQANAAGGAIVLDITCGKWMIITVASGINSGTNTLQMLRNNEDNTNEENYLAIASGAGTGGAIPRDGLNTTTSSLNVVTAGSPLVLLFGPGDKFTIRQTGAGAQNDTLVITVRALVQGATPSVSKARSTNQANVAITETVNRTS